MPGDMKEHDMSLQPQFAQRVGTEEPDLLIACAGLWNMRRMRQQQRVPALHHPADMGLLLLALLWQLLSL